MAGWEGLAERGRYLEGLGEITLSIHGSGIVA